jgi:hypothetical protein
MTTNGSLFYWRQIEGVTIVSGTGETEIYPEKRQDALFLIVTDQGVIARFFP